MSSLSHMSCTIPIFFFSLPISLMASFPFSTGKRRPVIVSLRLLFAYTKHIDRSGRIRAHMSSVAAGSPQRKGKYIPCFSHPQCTIRSFIDHSHECVRGGGGFCSIVRHVWPMLPKLIVGWGLLYQKKEYLVISHRRKTFSTQCTLYTGIFLLWCVQYSGIYVL